MRRKNGKGKKHALKGKKRGANPRRGLAPRGALYKYSKKIRR